MTDKHTDCGSVAAHGDEVECPGCGRVLPETTGQDWEVTDGDPLGCGCAGCWSADGDSAWPVHDDLCLQCAQDEIDDLRAELALVTECRSVFAGDDLRRILEWHEEVRTTRGISAADDGLRKRIVGVLRDTDCGSSTGKDGEG